MKIGITERGDAGINFAWIDKLIQGKVNGAVLITKECNDTFISNALANKDKVIVHATCTGYGGTVIEPGVPSAEWQMGQVKRLLDAGFPAAQLVLRIDPVIPTPKGLITAEKPLALAAQYGIPLMRARMSVLDAYPFVKKRFANAGIPLPYGELSWASPEQFQMVDAWVAQMQAKYNVRFESCAERYMTVPEKVGCISQRDIDILGLNYTLPAGSGYQRPACLCPACKTEMLDNRHPCKHNCLYCYWLTEKEEEKYRKELA